MSIVSISRGSYCRGEEVAQKVAERLGYTCLAREVILEASETYNVPEIRLTDAIADPPKLFDRLKQDHLRYIAYIRNTLLGHFLDDNVVYHGFAGHIFLKEVSHALKVRVIADPEDRMQIGKGRDKVSEQEARENMEKRDKARRDWGLYLYGVDPADPSLYDSVIHVSKMGVDGATDMICSMVEQDAFQTTPRSQMVLRDLALAAAFEVALLDGQPDLRGVEVRAQCGTVHVRIKNLPHLRGGSDDDTFRRHYAHDLRKRLLKRSLGLSGLKDVEVELADE